MAAAAGSASVIAGEVQPSFNRPVRIEQVAQASQPIIIVYTHVDCAYSAAAKADFRKRKIAFTEIDVSKQRDKVAELLKLTNGERVTPVIVENGQVTIGFKGGY
jgi:glutaredoxin